jgi:RNA polymerase sigma-70 factor (family 1)
MAAIQKNKGSNPIRKRSVIDMEALFVSFRDGKKLGFDFYYNNYKKLLFYYARKLVGNDPEAEEVVADSFIKLYTNRSKFKSADDIQGFLLRVARNHCYDIYRIKAREQAGQSEFYYAMREMRKDTRNPEHLFILAEMIHAIHHEIENLPDRAREIFKLVYLEGKTTHEISLQLNIEKKTVLNQKERARKLLKAALLKKDLSAAALLLPYLISTLYRSQ